MWIYILIICGMKEFISQVHESIDCPVRNCSCNLNPRCSALEIKESLEKGKAAFKRNASYH